MALAIASGLVYIHNAGILHQSLRPDNIVFKSKNMLQKPQDPKIVDFGNSKFYGHGGPPIRLKIDTPLKSRYMYIHIYTCMYMNLLIHCHECPEFMNYLWIKVPIILDTAFCNGRL